MCLRDEYDNIADLTRQYTSGSETGVRLCLGKLEIMKCDFVKVVFFIDPPNRLHFHPGAPESALIPTNNWNTSGK